jgi:hypothetical protein
VGGGDVGHRAQVGRSGSQLFGDGRELPVARQTHELRGLAFTAVGFQDDGETAESSGVRVGPEFPAPDGEVDLDVGDPAGIGSIDEKIAPVEPAVGGVQNDRAVGGQRGRFKERAGVRRPRVADGVRFRPRG